MKQQINSNDLIKCFQDTQSISSGKLLRETQRAVRKQRVYREGFAARRKKPLFRKAEIILEENTSFRSAMEYRGYGKTAVLNFANPVNPGGGVCFGAMAQEECLCRSSNLYMALSDENVAREYYDYNKSTGDCFFTDRVIYTPKVTVFKSDDPLPAILDEKSWFEVDVITCAAPYIADRKYINKKVIRELFRARIRNIFEVAIKNRVTVLILGAFGCGAFGNPPEVVAGVFCDVIRENKYDRFFKKIVFAIKSTGSASGKACRNLLAFESEFRAQQLSNDKNFIICSRESEKVNEATAPALRLTMLRSGEIFIINNTPTSVGSSEKCDIKIQQDVISRKHIIFMLERGIWYLQDNNSTNGTWLDGEKMVPGVKYPIMKGAKINLANKEEINAHVCELTIWEGDIDQRELFPTGERGSCGNVTLYGCPNARIMVYPDLQDRLSVEVIDYDGI